MKKIKVPKWLKFFFYIILASIGLTALSSAGEWVIPPLLFLIGVFFPGPNPKRPRILSVLPYLFGLSWCLTLVFLICDWKGIKLSLDPEVLPTTNELYLQLIATPVLIWILIKKEKWTPIALGISATVSTAILFFTIQSQDLTKRKLYSDLSEITIEVCLAAYLYKKLNSNSKSSFNKPQQ